MTLALHRTCRQALGAGQTRGYVRANPYTEKAHTMHKHTEAGGKRGIGSFLSVQDLFTLLNAACGVLAAFCAISGQFSWLSCSC